MQVKGTAVESIPVFVKEKFTDDYDKWLDSLSSESAEIFKKPILASRWYPIQPAIVEPTRKICDLFFKGSDKGAWKAGEFSAEKTLHGIYKVFVKAGTPKFIISRAGTIFSNFYSPSKIEVVTESQNSVIVKITEFETPDFLVECRIAGWIKKALEINGCKIPQVTINQSLAKGDSLTSIVCSWK